MVSTAMILWSLVFGSIGLGYFIYGRKQANKIASYAGIALMVYPYFVSSLAVLILIGAGLMLLPKFLKI